MTEFSATPSQNAVVIAFTIILSVPVIATAVSILYDDHGQGVENCEQLTALLEQQDLSSSVPNQGVLLIGDERLRRWRYQPKELAGADVLTRHVSGLNLERIADCFQRAVAFYRPAITVWLPSEQELAIGNDALTRHIQQIFERRTYYSVSPFLAIAMPPNTPAIPNQQQRLAATIDLLRSSLEQQAGTALIDVSADLAASSGLPDPTLFWPDGKTLNERGLEQMFEGLSAQLPQQQTKLNPLK
ncbi:MAG: hypothetical protein RLZZ602_1119 [Pseudomonadota bacterium]